MIIMMFTFFLLCSVTWSDIAGTQYKPGALVVVQTNLMPQFGVIDDITVVNSEELVLFHVSSS